MADTLPLTDLVDAFRARLVAAGRGADARIIETHISLLLLAGDEAWKFKKPVSLGFVDFSTLARRQHFCAREVALNARYAPRLYLGVETIEEGGTREYAVHMRRFGAEATLAEQLPLGTISVDSLRSFATQLARQHGLASAVDPASPYGSAALARAQVEACISAPLAPLLPTALHEALLTALDSAMPLLAARHADGRVRDCHGDLHCANVVMFDGELQAFDCIEFNDELRIIDTLSDSAFLLMDLDYRGASTLANAFLNSYLEAADEVAALALLPLYCAYRALVRAKVALLRGAQDGAARDSAEDEATRHIALAERYLMPAGRAGLVLTHGVSGSGKSHYARLLAEQAGFIHLRSDIERRRVAGLALDARSDSAPDSGLYSPAMNSATYGRLHERAGEALAAGYSVVVDATFMRAVERAPFFALAESHGAPLHILACEAPADELRRRVAERAAQGRDASEATLEVLERQLREYTPLGAQESARVIKAHTLESSGMSPAALGRPRPH